MSKNRGKSSRGGSSSPKEIAAVGVGAQVPTLLEAPVDELVETATMREADDDAAPDDGEQLESGDQSDDLGASTEVPDESDDGDIEPSLDPACRRVTVIAINTVAHNGEYYAPGTALGVSLEQADALIGAGYAKYPDE